MQQKKSLSSKYSQERGFTFQHNDHLKKYVSGLVV